MTKENAEKVAESFRQSHEQVEVYYDDDGDVKQAVQINIMGAEADL